MPFVIKHKERDRFVSNGQKSADYDGDLLVSIDYARFYGTEAGARLGLNWWCRYSVSGIVNQEKKAQYEVVKWPS